MHFFTSISNNYLPKARVLAKSIRKYRPEDKISVVLCDEPPNELDLSNEPFNELITIENLGIPVKNLNVWIYQHTIVELCTAVKGQALLNFLENGSDSVVYLDPDIVVYDNLEELEGLLQDDGHDVILTPHQTAPEDTDFDVRHNEICSLQHGIYNFGFFAVKNSPNGLRFARWWRDRLVDYCYDDIPNGLFTDQKWGDLAPALLDGIYILREPNYNVSTWNLTHRDVTKEGERYFVNGRPLQFYHFSGFDSGAQENMLNFYGKNNAVLWEMRSWYIEALNAEGQNLYGKRASTYSFYQSGKKIGAEERKLFKDRLDLQKHFGQTNPFEDKVPGRVTYYDWFYSSENMRKDDNQMLFTVYVKEYGDVQYTEKKKVCCCCSVKTELHVELDLSEFKKIEALRIDPLEHPCLLCESRISLLNQGGERVLLSAGESNGTYLTNEVLLFNDVDPHVFLTVPCGDYRSITFDCKVLLHDSSELYKRQCRAMETELVQTKNAYNAISNAFFWKITKPFRVILDAMKSLLKRRQKLQE